MLTSFGHNKRIGLLADSHGQASKMAACIHRLQLKKPDVMIHLGDIFDSQYFRESIEILSMIRQYRILAVKGNNDYQFQKLLMNGCPHEIRTDHKEEFLSFLNSIPMRIEAGGICFTHSLPYDSIRSFYEPVDTGYTDRAESIFQDTAYHMIFCGHSHNSILFRLNAGKVTREAVSQHESMQLHSNQRYIFVAGSTQNGECGFLDLAHMEYEKIRL
jgi:predicted phosphodiesterase